MPSRSQPSKRRSSSRRSSSRGSKGSSKAIVKKTAAHDGANFWVMLAGFVCGITVLLLIVSLFAKPEINSDMLAANDENRADVATRVESQDFDTFVENSSVEELIKTLKSLQDVKSFETEAKFVTNVQRQQMIVDNLMDKPLSDEDRRLAVLARIEGTAKLFWFDDRKVIGEADPGIRLREVTETHVNNSDPKVAYEARIQLAKLNAADALNRAVPVAKELHQLLADFPNDVRVHDTIKQSLNRLVRTPSDRPVLVKVLDQFFKQPTVKGDPEVDYLYVLLRDLENLCELNFYDSYDNVKYTGEAGRDQLRDVCLDLAKIPTAGKEIIGHLALSAQWMEANGHYQHAIDIYKAIITSAERLPNQEQAAAAQQQGRWGIKRCQAVDKPFDLAVNMYNGQLLKLSVIESMPVLIVFWSRSDGTENILYEVEQASRRWRRNSVKIIAVQVERDENNFDQELTRSKAEKFPKWSFCYDNGRGTGPIFSQIPGNRNGRIALLDRQHNLYDVDVDQEELVTSVNSVLATRSVKN